MPTIKIPLTDEMHHINPGWVYVAMDRNGVWYGYETEPFTLDRLWGSNGKYTSITKTPELRALLNWKDSLYRVEDVLCEPSESR